MGGKAGNSSQSLAEQVIPAQNKLPFIDPCFFDRMLQILPVEEIVALFTALLFEQKSILVVCQDKYDALPVITSVLSLIYPLEWAFAVVPLMKHNPLDENNTEMECFLGPPAIMGIHESQFQTMLDEVFEEDCKKTETLIIDLRKLYGEGYD